MPINRRSFLKTLGTSAMALSLGNAFPRRASAFTAGVARRVIFYYFPDGIPEPAGQQSQWHLSSLSSLTTCLQPLQPYVNNCIFFNGLSMGPTDAGSHPGGAKKLLTATDYGHGESIDRYLARTVGSDTPFNHVYLGAMATQNNASGDKFISYPAAETTVAPEDDPAKAFQRLFNGVTGGSGGGGSSGGGSTTTDDGTKSILDAEIADTQALIAKLGTAEQSKLNLHLEALRDLEARLVPATTPTPAPAPGSGSTCVTGAPNSLGLVNETAAGLIDPGNFPAILRAQMDVMVNAMACGLTRVGVIQASQHTSELIMSRFADVPALYTPNYDMRSHQASHYGAVDTTSQHSLWLNYVAQVTWFVQQLAYLLAALKSRPEGDGTMLDYTMVLIGSEISDGNTHLHDNMPFILAGNGGGKIKTGQLLSFNNRRHGDLFISMARAMGNNLSSFGDSSSGPLPGVLA